MVARTWYAVKRNLDVLDNEINCLWGVEMAKLVSFVYCMNAIKEPEPSNALNAINVVSSLRPDYIPGGFSFSVVFSILDIKLDSPSNAIRVRFLNKENDEVVADSGTILLPAQSLSEEDQLLPQQYRGFNMSLDFRNIIFKQSGLYATEIVFNGESLGTQDIFVQGKINNDA